MKKLKLILAGLFLFALSVGVLAQTDPPNPPGEHGGDADVPAGGQAPIGGGVLLLIGMGLVYGGKKVYDLRKKATV